MPRFAVISLALFVCFWARGSFALVEYSQEREESGIKARLKKSKPAPKPTQKSRIRRLAKRPVRSVRTHSPKIFDFSMGVESIDAGSSGKNDFYLFSGLIRTPFNVFIQGQYRYGEESSGNPEVLLGVNWLRFGPPQDAVTLDLYGGASIAQSDAQLASSRTDKIFGFQTKKQFFQFAFGLGFEQRLTGTPDNREELAVGNIQNLTASLDWRVSGDIFFSLGAGTGRISPKRRAPAGMDRMRKRVSFGYISPLIKLNISPLTALSLGATFRTKKVTNKGLLRAKLWDVEGLYGNTLTAGLSLSF